MVASGSFIRKVSEGKGDPEAWRRRVARVWDQSRLSSAVSFARKLAVRKTGPLRDSPCEEVKVLGMRCGHDVAHAPTHTIHPGRNAQEGRRRQPGSLARRKTV